MQINRAKRFKQEFQSLYEYIAKDKLSAAKQFRSELNKELQNLKVSPFKYRKSFYFNDESIRDMIFKGYTIVYEVDKKNNVILILTIFNQNKR